MIKRVAFKVLLFLFLLIVMISIISATDDTSIFSCNDDGIISILLFNETGGGNLNNICDSETWSKFGTPSEGISSNTTSGLGINLNPSDYYVSSKNYGNYTYDRSISIMFVVNITDPTASQNDQILFSNTDGATNGMFFQRVRIGDRLKIIKNGASPDYYVEANNTFYGGVVYLITWVQNFSSGENISYLYINDTLVGYGHTDLNPATGATAAVINDLSYYLGNGYGADATYYDFAFFDKALNQQEISAYYNNLIGATSFTNEQTNNTYPSLNFDISFTINASSILGLTDYKFSWYNYTTSAWVNDTEISLIPLTVASELDSNLVSVVYFNESSGNLVAYPDGTVYSPTGSPTYSVEGYYTGKDAVYTDINDYFTGNKSYGTYMNADWSVNMVVRGNDGPVTYNSYDAIWSNNVEGCACGVYFAYDRDNLRYYFWSGGSEGGVAYFPTSINESENHMLTMIYHQATLNITLFVDGVEIEQNGGGTIDLSGGSINNVVFNSYAPNPSSVKGDHIFSEWAFFDTALSQSQINVFYNKFANGGLTPVSAILQTVKTMPDYSFYNYTWYAKNTLGDYAQSDYYSLTYQETNPPTFSNNIESSNPAVFNENVSINITINDDTGISSYIFSYYNITEWLNDSIVYTNNETELNVSVSKIMPIDNFFNYTWYAFDSFGTIGKSDFYNITLIEYDGPTFGIQTVNKTFPFVNDTLNFTMEIFDFTAVDYAIFSYYNDTIWINETILLDDSVFVNASIAQMVYFEGLFNYTWFAYDTFGNVNQSDFYNIFIYQEHPMTFTNPTLNISYPFEGADIEINITINDLNGVKNYTFSYFQDLGLNDSQTPTDYYYTGTYYGFDGGMNDIALDGTTPTNGDYANDHGWTFTLPDNQYKLKYTNVNPYQGTLSLDASDATDLIVNMGQINLNNNTFAGTFRTMIYISNVSPANTIATIGWVGDITGDYDYATIRVAPGVSGNVQWIDVDVGALDCPNNTIYYLEITGRWIELMLTLNGTTDTLRGYVDGRLCGEKFANVAGADQFSMQSQNTNNVWFDNVQIWNGNIQPLEPVGAWTNDTTVDVYNGTGYPINYTASVVKSLPVDILGDFNYTWYANDILGNIYQSDYYNFTIGLLNIAPFITSIEITPASPYNPDNLNCNFIVNDVNSDPMNVSLSWLKNNVEVHTYDVNYTGLDSNILYVTTVGNGSVTEILTTGDNWSCSINVSDEEFYTYENSPQITVLDASPEAPTITQPLNNTIVSRYNTTITWFDGYVVYGNNYNVTLSIKNETGDVILTEIFDNIYPNSYCYQETANESSVCGLDTGKYFASDDYTNPYFYVNYTTPNSALDTSKWLVKNDMGTQTLKNVSIPTECWDSTLQFRIWSDGAASPSTYGYLECYNSTDWQIINSSINATGYGSCGSFTDAGIENYLTDGDWDTRAGYGDASGGCTNSYVWGEGNSAGPRIYEEAMWWAFNSTIQSYLWDTSSYAEGSYELTMYQTNVYTSSSNTTVTNITINTPSTLYPFELPSVLYNNDTLEGWVSIIDVEQNFENADAYDVRWYKNTDLNTTDSASLLIDTISSNITLNVVNLSSNYLTVYDSWIFSLNFFDGYDWSGWQNSSALSVSNRVLRDLNIHGPANNTITNEHLNVTFNVTDEDEGIVCILYTNQAELSTNKSVLSNVDDYLSIDEVHDHADAVYIWNVSCTSEGDTTPLVSGNYNFDFHTEPPIIANFTTNEINTSPIFFPQIGDTFIVNLTVIDDHGISSCELYINDTGTFENKTIAFSGATNDTVILEWLIPSSVTASNNKLAWFANCSDFIGNSNVTDIQPFTVYDITLPLIIESANVQNNSIISGALYDVSYNFTFFDYNLFQAMVNVSCELSGTIYYWEILDINTTLYSIADTIDLSGYTLQKCNFFSAASDDHTKKEWKIAPGQEKKLSDGLEFNTPEKINVKITANEAKNIIKDKDKKEKKNKGKTTTNKVKDTKTTVKEDRTSFEFKLEELTSYLVFDLETTQPLYYRASGYPAHFVSWNDNEHKGNWIDFKANGLSLDDYTVIKISDYHYEIIINSDVEIDSITFESLGGTNVENSSFDFYIGGAINVSGLNIYDNTSFGDFYVDIISTDDYSPYTTTTIYIPGTYGWIENISNGNFTFDFRASGRYFNQSYSVTVENVTQERPYETYESIVLIYFKNIKTLVPITYVSTTINNSITDFSKQYDSESNSYIIYYLNASDYTFYGNNSNYIPYENTFSTTLLSNQTLTYYFYLYSSFVLLDEATEGEFNVSSADSIKFVLYCFNTTYTTIINSSTQNLPIVCDYDKFKFVLTYGTESYYRTFIYEEPEIFNVSVYLIDLTTTQSIYNSFIIDDLLSEYDNPSLYVKKIIGDKTVIITADYADVENKIGAYLIQNHEYIIEVDSDNNPIRLMGTYSADSPGDKNVRLYDVTIAPEPSGFSNAVSSVLSMQNISDTPFIVGSYEDKSNLTDSVTFTIYEGTVGGTVLLSTTYYNVSSIDLTFNVSEYSNSTLIGTISIDYNGQNYEYGKILHSVTEILLGINQYLSGSFLNWFFTLLLGVLALMATIRSANIMSIVLVAMASLFTLFGWFGISWSILILALLISLLSFLKQEEKL